MIKCSKNGNKNDTSSFIQKKNDTSSVPLSVILADGLDAQIQLISRACICILLALSVSIKTEIIMKLLSIFTHFKKEKAKAGSKVL
jgi:hypothetical protein